MPATRPIVFETDFGLGNEWVGLCHAVIARIAPESRVIDLSHLVRPLDVAGGARLLADSLPYLPDDAVLLAVVDPNVGRDRDIVVEAADGRLLVGPDNGLLSPAWSVAGGAVRAVEVTAPEVIIEPVAPSLHARDVLCPAAAHLAVGTPLEQLGPPLESGSLASLHLRDPDVERGKICCEVIDYNRFGNIQLNVRRPDLVRAGLDSVEVMAVEAVAGSVHAKRGETYADFQPGEYGVIFDPRGWLQIIRGNPGNALQDLQLSLGDLVWLTDDASAAHGAHP